MPPAGAVAAFALLDARLADLQVSALMKDGRQVGIQ